MSLWSSIEVVITSTIGNRVAAETARGFESLLLRHQKSSVFVANTEDFAMYPEKIREKYYVLPGDFAAIPNE